MTFFEKVLTFFLSFFKKKKPYKNIMIEVERPGGFLNADGTEMKALDEPKDRKGNSLYIPSNKGERVGYLTKRRGKK